MWVRYMRRKSFWKHLKLDVGFWVDLGRDSCNKRLSDVGCQIFDSMKAKGQWGKAF